MPYDVRPEAGHFPIIFTATGSPFTVKVKLSDISGYNIGVCGQQPVYMIVHLDLLVTNGSGVTTAQTAFGGDQDGNGPAWWYYVAYVPSCCGENPSAACHTETAFGGNSDGLLLGGKAWWFYFKVADGSPQAIYAGKKLIGGGSNVTLVNGTLTINLGSDMTLQNVTEPVKIQGYNVLPATRQPAGLFTTYKGKNLVIPVPAYPYYVIHLDVKVCGE